MAITNEELTRRMLLHNAEKFLRRQLQEVDWPFLGLFGEKLNKDMRAVVFNAISANPTVEGFLRHLQLYPALFSIYLCQILLQTFGREDHFQLWPEIKRALRTSELNQTNRELLCGGFRNACLKIGLEVSSSKHGSHYMVNEFLRQVGLSEAFAGDLVTRALRFASRNGLPDEDDPQGIIAWQESLSNTLNVPFSRSAKAAVDNDRQGYYTQLLLRVIHSGGTVSENESPIAKAFAKMFKLENIAIPANIGRAAIPQVQFQNGALGIMLPAGGHREWTVLLDDESRKYRTSGSEQFVVFDHILPRHVVVQDDTKRQVLSVPLWANDRNNQVLIFSSETGLLKGCGALGSQVEQDFQVSPGIYCLLSRFDPGLDGEEAECLSEDPALYLSMIRLSPGDRRELRRGPAFLEISVTAEPVIIWQGSGVVSREGQSVYPDSNLVAQIEIPQELRTDIVGFVLELSAGDGGILQTVVLKLDNAGRADVPLAAIFREGKWKAGLWRVLAQVKRTGEARTLVRSAALCWIGLKEFRSGLRFICTEKPSNLFEPGCENIRSDASEVACANTNRRMLRLVFALDKRREVSLSWAVPGVFADLLEYDEQGLVIRKPLTIGKTILASTASSQQIVITADRTAELKIGNFCRKVDFATRGSVTLPLGSLADCATADDANLTYHPLDGRPSLVIARLVRPQQVLKFDVRVEFGKATIRLVTANPIESVQIRGQEILSGKERTLVTDSEITGENGGTTLGCKIVLNEDGCTTLLRINLADFNSGAWVFWLEVLYRGSWGRLTNARGDYFVTGVLLAEDGFPLQNQKLDVLLKNLSGTAVARALGRFNEALQYCYDQQVWSQISWLGQGWKLLVDRCAADIQGNMNALFNMVAEPLPESSSPSWLPQLTIPSRLPIIFTLPALEYRGLSNINSLLVHSLLALGDIAVSLHEIIGKVLHVGSVAGFSNLPAIAGRGAKPNGFDSIRFVQAMRSLEDRETQYLLADDAFIPGDGQLLGPIHYRYGKIRFEDRFARTLGGNEFRRSQAMKMARQSVRFFGTLHAGSLSIPPVLDPWLLVIDDSAQEILAITELEHFLSAFAWHARLSARQPGALTNFLTKVTPEDVDVETPLGFLLYVGEELLSFYLLLWEIVLMADYDVRPQSEITSTTKY